MCRHPILVDNPNRKTRVLYNWIKNKDPTYISSNPNLILKDTHSIKIPVPCGKCPECLALKQNAIVQRCQMEVLDNDLYFGTLTYNNESLKRINVNGYNIAYADISDWQNMIKRIRKSHPELKFRYLLVSEFGSVHHRPHFHFLLSVPPEHPRESLAEKVSRSLELHDIFLSEWRRNYGSTRSPIYKNLCDYVVSTKGRTFDLHYVNPSLSSNGQSDVAFYVSKYVTKANPYVDALKSALFYNTPDTDSFTELWNIVKPRVLMSKGFGNPTSPKVIEHINNSVKWGLDNTSYQYPVYVNPITSQTFPLCPYYRKKFLTLMDQYGFFYKSTKTIIDGVLINEDYDPVDYLKKDSQSLKKCIQINNRDNYNEFLSELEDDDFKSFISDYIGVPIQFNKLTNSFTNESNEY